MLHKKLLGLILISVIACNASRGDTAESFRYLALDPTLHAMVQNLSLEMGQAEHKAELFRQFDTAWEKDHGLELGALGRVFKDHDGRFRMYYELMHANAERATAVAFSDDGLHWTKPALNIARNIVDHPDANLIEVLPAENDPGRGLLDGKWYRGAHAFYDAHATNLDERYKLVWRQGHDIYVASSPDGLHFKTHGRAVNYYADTSPSHFYDPLRGEYVIYGRVWLDKEDRPTIQDRLGGDGHPPTRRGVVLHRSPDWSAAPWPEDTVGDVLIDPMNALDKKGWTDIYTPNVQVYHGQYIGLPAVFFRRPSADLTETEGPLYPVFMHSRDGRVWDFPGDTHPIVDLKPHLIAETDPPEVGMIFPASRVVEKDGELLVYYSDRHFQHYEGSPGDHSDVRFHVAALRKDGFARLKTSGQEPGVWMTPPIAVPEGVKALHVNAHAAGHVAVDLCESDTGRPIPGFSGISGARFTGDRVGGAMAWPDGSVESFAGKRVRLRFTVVDGEIFSFWFE